uniref:Uncharacterized protein n=1 Tax=Romanomermis culicivorax TaxID=13658 RepID=A0A915HVP8_ROMCU
MYLCHKFHEFKVFFKLASALESMAGGQFVEEHQDEGTLSACTQIVSRKTLIGPFTPTFPPVESNEL